MKNKKSYVDTYLNSLQPDEKSIIEKFRKVILKNDKKVEEKCDKIMSISQALVYTQEDVFKYGLSVTKNYISYHSMVMYANPQLIDGLKGKLKNIRIQKGCINFKSLQDFPISEFEKLLIDSAKINFEPVISHHKNRR